SAEAALAAHERTRPSGARMFYEGELLGYEDELVVGLFERRRRELKEDFKAVKKAVRDHFHAQYLAGEVRGYGLVVHRPAGVREEILYHLVLPGPDSLTFNTDGSARSKPGDKYTDVLFYRVSGQASASVRSGAL